jgi:hypothetical protein
LTGLAAPVQLVAARVRHRPGRWLWPVLGLTLSVAFACGVAAEGTIAGDRAARATLAQRSPLQRAVTITDQQVVSDAADRRARNLLSSLGLPAPTRTVLLNPVRLSGRVVRLAAIDPLPRWAGRSVGACRPRACPAVLVGGTVGRRTLRAPGVRIVIAGAGRLRSAAPLGFEPTAHGQPLLVSGDVNGLAALPALSSLYRTRSWVTEAPLAGLHSWQLADLQRRLTRAQSELPAGVGLSLSAPTDALAQARDRAAAAPRRLLPAGGGALAVLAMFVILAAYGLRRDQQAERGRLRAAGARAGALVVFALTEAAWLAAVAVLAGAALGLAVAALLAREAGLPAGAVLSHSLLTVSALATLAGGWATAVAVIGAVLLAPGGRAADVLALAAAAALALALTVGSADNRTLTILAAPLACLAAAGLVYRAAGMLLRQGERLARGGPLVLRLALVDLARSPVAPALAVAFVAVSTGLGGFALGYRATLERGAADEAAQQVPLDARIGPSTGFVRPLQMAGVARWQALSAGGRVLSVRRTDASLPLNGNNITIPALGVPASALMLIRGWRAGDGSASPATLANRLAPDGPVRTPGPQLPTAARRLTVRVQAPDGEVQLSADLRNAAGTVTQVPLGMAAARPRLADGRLPASGGPYELEAFEIDEPSGEQTLNGHQNGENPAAATQSATTVALGPVSAGGEVVIGDWRSWRGAGAATLAGATLAGASSQDVRLRFDNSGQPGVLRPHQPSDNRPVPVLTDRGTAAGAGPGGLLPLTVDGEPVNARVVGTLRRFPTLTAAVPGFVVADEATLDGALDASLPGQGATDELWIATPRPGRLHAALGRPPLQQLSASFRTAVERALREDPIARGVLGTLLVAAAVSGALALLGLLAALLGAMRDRRVERDLEVLGLSPRQRRRELALRVTAAGVLGTLAGLALAGLLTRLVVGAVRAAGAVAVPDPPLVAVAPWGELALLALAAIGAFALVGGAAAWMSTVRR